MQLNVAKANSQDLTRCDSNSRFQRPSHDLDKLRARINVPTPLNCSRPFDPKCHYTHPESRAGYAALAPSFLSNKRKVHAYAFVAHVIDANDGPWHHVDHARPGVPTATFSWPSFAKAECYILCFGDWHKECRFSPLRGRGLARLVKSMPRASITTVQGRYGLLIGVKTRSCVGGSKSTDVCRSKITKETRRHRRRFKISLVSRHCWHWRVRPSTRDITFPDTVPTGGFHPAPSKFHFKQREAEEGKGLSKKKTSRHHVSNTRTRSPPDRENEGSGGHTTKCGMQSSCNHTGEERRHNRRGEPYNKRERRCLGHHPCGMFIMMREGAKDAFWLSDHGGWHCRDYRTLDLFLHRLGKE